MRFLTLTDVAETLNISAAQTYALVRNGELPAIKVGGRGQWRVEGQVLESYIADMYTQTKQFVQTHPLSREPLSKEPLSKDPLFKDETLC
jgi:excisionase family DNA binding protein